jgi:hypothetical protein
MKVIFQFKIIQKLGSSTITYNLPQKPQTCALNDVQIQTGAYTIPAKRQPKLKKGFMTII